MDLTLSRPNLRDRQKAETGVALVAAAAQVFADRGYAQATIDDVAKEAGTSRATFYLHFSSKADAMQAVIDEVRSRAAAWADDLPSPAASRAEVDEVVRSWVAFYKANLDWMRVWHEASAAEPGIEPPIRTAGSRVVAQVIGHEVGETNPRADVVASTTFHLLDRLLHGTLVQGWALPEEELIDEVVEAWHVYFIPRLRELLP